MIDLYTWTTPNGRKASIALEELGLPYRAHAVDISRDEQFRPEFLAINPNNKIPAIVDGEAGVTLFESGAILLYLAEKTGRLLPDGLAKWDAVQWLMWQMGGFGPMLGQANHFLTFAAGKSDYGEERFGKETARLYGVLDKRLQGRDFVAGDMFTVADIAIWPWAAAWKFHKVDLNDYGHVAAWYRRLAERPGVQRGFGVPKPAEIPMP